MANTKRLLEKGMNPELNVEEKRRADWEDTNNLVRHATVELWSSKKRYPTSSEVSRYLNIPQPTVWRHMQEIYENPLPMFIEMKTFFLMNTPEITAALFNTVQKGNVEAIKLALALMFNYVSPKDGSPPESGNSGSTEVTDEDVEMFTKYFEKKQRQKERDAKLGIVEGEVVDAKKAS